MSSISIMVPWGCIVVEIARYGVAKSVIVHCKFALESINLIMIIKTMFSEENYVPPTV